MLVLAIISQATEDAKSRNLLKRIDAVVWLLWGAPTYLDLMNVEYNHKEWQSWILEGCQKRKKQSRSRARDPNIAGVISGHLDL